MQNVYSIFDLKGSTYEGLYTFVSDIDAVRFFDAITLRTETKFFTYPEDFALVCLGSFDDRTGSFSACEATHRMITTVLDRKVFFEVQKQIFEQKVVTEKGETENA